eukprot:GHVN01036827.1.p2 GENE.GHVN01036827.1~~GHVN01036827.1.p2  ORF type:complete len:105 (-),score=18.40 GHVN01036827.1:1279-1593(-)
MTSTDCVRSWRIGPFEAHHPQSSPATPPPTTPNSYVPIVGRPGSAKLVLTHDHHHQAANTQEKNGNAFTSNPPPAKQKRSTPAMADPSQPPGAQFASATTPSLS